MKNLLSKQILSFILLFIFGLVFKVNAQSTDCDGAVGVCSNGNIDANSSGPGSNDFSGGSGSLGCIDAEHQTLWLYVQIESGSTLGFEIDPISSDDYDFAVYGPNRSCDNLGDPIRCSWAAGSSNTGMNGASSDFSEGAGGDGFVSWLNVNPGESYFILIDNYSSSNQGFTLEWSGNNNLNCDVELPCPIIDLGPDTAVCDGSLITLGQSEVPNVTYEWSTGATTPSIDVSESGIYWLAATKDTCTVYDTIQVSLLESPIIYLGADTTLCEGEVITLDATHPDATGYLWQDGSTSPTYTVTSQGTYTVEVLNDICSGTDEIVVAYDAIPVFDLGNDTTLCDLSSYTLDVGTANVSGNQYLWQDSSTGPTYTATSSGLYSVKVSNTACFYEDEIELDFQDSPILDLGADESFCEGDTIVLSAYDVNTSTYLWQDGSTSSTYEVTTSGDYMVTTSNGQCVSEDEITITFLSYPIVELHADTSLCDNEPLVLDAFASDATSYQWQDGSNSSEFTVTEPGTYIVTVGNEFCTISDSTTIEYKFLPVFNLPEDTIMCKGNAIELIVSNQSEEVTYTWQDNSTDSVYVVSMQGYYSVVVENQCGPVVDSVFVEYGSCDCEFFMPTAFTPNRDGLNDYYQPIFDCDSLTSFEFEIFNRWGDMVYSSTNAEEGWEGPNSNNINPMDAYAWIMRYKWSWRGKEMSFQENGFFTIIR